MLVRYSMIGKLLFGMVWYAASYGMSWLGMLIRWMSLAGNRIMTPLVTTGNDPTKGWLWVMGCKTRRRVIIWCDLDISAVLVVDDWYRWYRQGWYKWRTEGGNSSIMGCAWYKIVDNVGWSQDVNCKMLSLVLTTVDKGNDNDLGDSGRGHSSY